MKIRLLKGIFLFSLFGIAQLSAQDGIQLSGIVIRLDSIKAVPYTNIYVRNTTTGVISDEMGLFSILVQKKDTVVFSSVGSRTTYFIVPDSLTGSSYSIIQKMPHDTVKLKTVEISSWPSLEQFNYAFSREHGFDDQQKIAQRNSNPQGSEAGRIIDNSAYMENRGDRFTYVYENASIPLDKVLNPKRWNILVDDWKNGKHR